MEYDDPKVQKKWVEFQKLTPEERDRLNDRSICDFLNVYPEHVNKLLEILSSNGLVGLKAKERHRLGLFTAGTVS